MALTLPNPEPVYVTAGDSLAWTVADSSYPAGDGWALSYSLLNAAGRITFSGAADGDAHAIAVDAATTAGWTPGRYRMSRIATKGAERITLWSSYVDVLPDPETAAPYDTRTHARRTLDAIEAWIEGRSLAVASYRIADRQMQYIPIAELLQIRDRYRQEVRREDAAANGLKMNKLQVRL